MLTDCNVSRKATIDSQAYVSLALNDTYATAAHVLGDSLRDTHTSRKLVVLVGEDVSQLLRCRLQQIWDHVIDIDTLDGEAISTNLEHPDLEKIFVKLKVWKLTQFTKCVFLDTDTLVIQNVDELFEREELAAAPDIGWPDCFNSAVFVFVPSDETYDSLVKHAEEHGSFDDTDQGLLNTYFKNWATTTASHLPYVYNMVSNACYTYAPAANYFGKNTKIVQFVGSQKPWTQHYDYGQSRVIDQQSEQSNSINSQYLNSWWNRYHTLQDGLLCQERNIENDGKQFDSQESAVVEKICGVSDQQMAWERGDIDFMHKDRFTVIRHYLDNAMGEMANEPYEEVQYESCIEHKVDDYIDKPVDGDSGNTPESEPVEYKNVEQYNQIDDGTNEIKFVYHLQSSSSEPSIVKESQYQEDATELSHQPTEDEVACDSGNENIADYHPDELDPDTAARLRWEIGNIDVAGEDSFSKIEMYLNSLLRQLELSTNIEDIPVKEYEELRFSTEGSSGDTSAINDTEVSRASRDTSPSLFSVTDSAYSDGAPRKPVMITRGTQTSFLCLSRAVQTEMDLDDVH